MPSQSTNIVWHQSQVSKARRAERFGQAPKTIWLTGLSASGKSTLAYALEHQLVEMGKACYVLDGDNVRHGLNQDLGFSEASRTENIRRVAEVAKLMNDAGLIVITAFISPLRSDRQMAKDIIGEAFREVFVSASIDVCESRDPKGLCAKARAGLVANFFNMKYIVLTSIALLLIFSFFTQSAFAADLNGARVGFMLAEKEYQSAKSTVHFKQDQLALVELKFKQISQELADAKAQMALANKRLETAESTLAAKQKVLDQEWAKTHPN